MEAIEFLKEYKRMCESMAVDECSVCPMSLEKNKHNVACSHLLKKCPEDACKIVEQWSKEHPIITNAKKFEEVFGFSLENTFILPSEVCNWLRIKYEESEHE